MQPQTPAATETPAEPTSQLRTPAVSRLFTIVAALAAGVFGTLWWTGRNPPGGSSGNTTTEQNRKLQQTALDNSQIASVLDSTSARGRWEEMRRQLRQTKQLSEEALDAVNTLQNRFVTLLTSEDGKRLSGNPEYVLSFQALRNKQRAAPEKVTGWQQDVTALLEAAEKAVNLPNLTLEPDEKIIGRVEALTKSVQAVHSGIKTDLRALDTLLAKAVTPGPTTLAKAIDARDSEDNQRHLKDVSEALEKVRREAEQQDTANATEAERKKLDAENKRKAIERETVLTKANAEKAKAERELANLKEDTEKKAAKEKKVREYEQDLAEMQNLLKPLITPGKMELTGSGWVQGLEAKPVSLSAVEGIKLLDPKNMNAAIYWDSYFGGRAQNDRPRGSFPDTQNPKAIRRVQELLLRHGEILVEKGLLRP